MTNEIVTKFISIIKFTVYNQVEIKNRHVHGLVRQAIS